MSNTSNENTDLSFDQFHQIKSNPQLTEEDLAQVLQSLNEFVALVFDHIQQQQL